jgi:hypothetical protein
MSALAAAPPPLAAPPGTHARPGRRAQRRRRRRRLILRELRYALAVPGAVALCHLVVLSALRLLAW